MPRRAIFVVFLALTIVGVSGFLLMRKCVRAATAVALRPREEVVDITALVTRVRELNRLETAAIRVIHISTITQSYQLVPNALAGDELTLLATGDVIAGIDLSQLKPEDVRREPDGTIILELPPAQILVSRIDNRESRVINRKTGVLRRADAHLESHARQNAEIGIRNEALRQGILILAEQNAETRLAEFLHTLGFQKVRFEKRGMNAER